MKTVMLLAIGSLFAISAFSDAPQGPGANQDRPCQRIKQACMAAGFEKGEAREGTPIYMNCMKPLLEDQAVQGVTVDAATLQACKVVRERWKGQPLRHGDTRRGDHPRQRSDGNANQ